MIARAVAPSPARVNTVAPRVRRVRAPISRVARVDVNVDASMRRVARPARARSRARVRRATARAIPRRRVQMRDRNTHTERNARKCRVYPRRIYAHIAFATRRSRGVKRANRRTCADQSKRATRARRPIETRDDVVATPRVPTARTHTPTRARWRRAARTTRRDALNDSRRIARRARRRGRGSGRSSGTRGDAWTRSSG